MKFFKFLKCAFSGHLYGNGNMNPFCDKYGNHSAIYTCEKCGHKKFHTFYK